MPVIYNQSMPAVLQKVGVDAAILAALSKEGWKATLEPEGIKFSQPGNLKTVKVPVFSTTLMAAAKGTLDPEQLKNLKSVLNGSLKKLLETGTISGTDYTQVEKHVASKPVDHSQTFASKATVTMVGGDGVGAYNYMLPALKEHQPFPLSQLQTAPIVPLNDAHGLYAPVRGSGAASRYFLIAVYPTFKVAARLKANKISLRLEGKLTPNAIKGLMALQFADSGGHWSAHVMVSDTEEAQRYVGCLLASLGEALLTPMPSMSVIAGKGAG